MNRSFKLLLLVLTLCAALCVTAAAADYEAAAQELPAEPASETEDPEE